MPANKNQHYVPKFLMRQFSSDPSPEPDRKWINLYLLKHRKFVPRAGIAGQCYGQYFYGKDSVIESGMTTLEGRLKSLLGDLSDGHLAQLNDDELFELRHLAYIHQQRTAVAAERIDLMFDATMKATFRRRMEVEGINIDQFKTSHGFPQGQALSIAIGAAPYLEDLQTCFIRSSRGEEFLLSDNPVVAYNQFAENHPYLAPRYSAACGIGNMGIQLFMPLAKDLCLAVYDPNTYQYGNCKNNMVRTGKLDVRKINAIQAANADSCLYIYCSSPDLSYLLDLSALNGRVKQRLQIEVRNGPIIKESETKRSQLVGFGIPDVRLGLKLTFVREISRIDFSGYNLGAFPPRSFEQVGKAKRFRDMLRTESLQASEIKEKNRSMKE